MAASFPKRERPAVIGAAESRGGGGLSADDPPSVCRKGLRERHRAAERIRGRGLQQEEVPKQRRRQAARGEFSVFCARSMFGSVELDSLDPCRVNYVNIKVVSDQDGAVT